MPRHSYWLNAFYLAYVVVFMRLQRLLLCAVINVFSFFCHLIFIYIVLCALCFVIFKIFVFLLFFPPQCNTFNACIHTMCIHSFCFAMCIHTYTHCFIFGILHCKSHRNLIQCIHLGQVLCIVDTDLYIYKFYMVCTCLSNSLGSYNGDL